MPERSGAAGGDDEETFPSGASTAGILTNGTITGQWTVLNADSAVGFREKAVWKHSVAMPPYPEVFKSFKQFKSFNPLCVVPRVHGGQ
jgi:hypothetical protein